MEYAVTTKAVLAREIATFKRRRSSSTSAFAALASISRRAVAWVRSDSTSRSLPRSEPRAFRFGQIPSCNPVIATKSHSRPFALCTVITLTTSPRWPRAAIASL